MMIKGCVQLISFTYEKNSVCSEIQTLTADFAGHCLMSDFGSQPTPSSAYRHSGPEVIKLFSCSTQLSMKF